ncbi:protein dispatched homolog 1-like [Ylistrum balloti]|uniref:protein dispatched homolog 1-like n=1 Tax=Ylistrum balloti TaxID=509963 RepID=UPI002905EBD6|nr:protein dispatched homolog 1-like [Ylistrum balloti]
MESPDFFLYLESNQSFTEKSLIGANQTKKKKEKIKKLKKSSPKVGVLEYNEHKADGVSPKKCTPTGNEKKDANKPPLLYCKFIANYPWCAFFLASSFHLTIIIATVCLVCTGYNLFPIEFKTMPLILNEDNTRTQDYAWRGKDSYSGKLWRPVTGAIQPAYYNGFVGDLVEVFLEVPNYDIFSRENLQLIRDAEERMFNIQYYQIFFCYVASGTECHKPSSVLRLFDGTFNSSSATFYDPTFSNIHGVLCEATEHNATKDYVKYFIEQGLDLCDGILRSSKTRFFYKLGWPLRGSDDSGKLENFLVSSVKPEMENIRDNLMSGKMSLYYISTVLFEYDVVIQALNDMLLAVGSFLFILVFMWFQTASFWITFLGIFSILTSFLLTNLIYRCVLGYEYFGFFHVISMFIILGIGADDVFIFYDTWRLTGHTIYPSKAHRLSDCYRKAAKTTFVTSLTTMTAFLVSGLSPLLPVCSFGIFSGILVFVNYLCDLLYFPTVIMLYSQKVKPFWDKMCGPCIQKCKKKKSKTSSEKQDDTISMNLSKFDIDIRKKPSTPFANRPESGNSLRSDILNTAMTPRTKSNFEDRSKIVLFLRNGFYDFITHRAVRIIVPLLFLGASSFFMWSASKLEPDSQQLQIYKATHNYARASRMHYYSFERSFEEEYSSVYLTWGIQRKDFSSCNFKSATFCGGVARWDDTFDPNTPEAQIALKNLCNRLETMSAEEADSLRIKRNAITDKLEIACFTSPYETYLQNKIDANGSVFPAGLSMNLPINAGNVSTFMDAQSSIYYPSVLLPSDFDHHMGIGVSYWLSDSYTGNPTDDYYLYNGLLGEQTIDGTTQRARNSANMYYASKLKYIGIRINTTLNVYKLGYPEGKPVYQRWEKLMAEELMKMPDTMKNGFQCTKNTWNWIKVQESLADSAVQGVIVGLGLALPILILTTLNVVIGFLATVTIGLVTACVIGIIPLAGWKLGVLESLNMCMVVGLSVDYVVHLAEAYATCPSPDRMDRVRNMLESMGLSVLSGAVTTFGAASFMLFSQIQFQYQFGIFVMSTISISLFFSFFAFTTFMSLCGPQGNTGSLVAFGKWLKSKCSSNNGEQPSSSSFGDQRTTIAIGIDTKPAVDPTEMSRSTSRVNSSHNSERLRL